MSPAANSPAVIVRAAWIRRRSRISRGSATSVSAHAPDLLWQPAAGRRGDEQRELGREERRHEQGQQRTGVGADQRRPPVALEVEPLAGALVELVVVVDAGGVGDPEPAAREPHAEREVDVLVVEEEGLGHAAQVRGRGRGGASRQAPETKPGSSTRRSPLAARVEGLARAAGPGDRGVVQDAASGVDRAAVVRGDQGLPGRPAPTVGVGGLDRLAPARLRNRVGVEQAEELPGRRVGAAVAGRGEPEVRAGLDHDRLRRQLAHQAAGVPSAEALSATISSSPSRSCAQARGACARARRATRRRR